MLQEGQSVGFEPITVCYVHHPWYVNLFILYLAIVLLLAAGCLVRLLWTLRKRRTAAKNHEAARGLETPNLRELSTLKVKSLRNLSHLTALISLLILSWSLSDHFVNVITQKVAGIGPLAAAAADALTTFSAGILVSTVLFCIAVLCERLIQRHKLTDNLS